MMVLMATIVLVNVDDNELVQGMVLSCSIVTFLLCVIKWEKTSNSTYTRTILTSHSMSVWEDTHPLSMSQQFS